MIVLGIFWLLFALAVIMPLRWSLTLLFVSLPFGSMTVIPGSINILPYVALSPLVVVKVLLTTRNLTNLWDGLLNWRRLGFLTAFIVVGMIVTYSAPYLFHGAPVMGLNTARLTPLGFSSGNITQPLYLTMSFLLCVALYMLMLVPNGPAMLATALLTGASMAVASGLLDMATAGTTLLAPLRTASYAILEGAEVANNRRVIGFNTEASSFGALVLSFASILIFMSPASWVGGRAHWLEKGLIAALLLMTVLSTSSSAYLGLIVLALMYLFRLALLLVTPRNGLDRRQSALSVLGLVMAVLIGCAYVVARPAILDGPIEVINNTLLEKSSSDSADERSSWNRVSLQGFMATGGYGVGVGSTRTSSWVVAVLSSTGVLGALMLLAFLVRGFLASLPRTNPVIRFSTVGARYAFLIVLIPAAVAGTLVDFGIFNAFFFAVMAASPKLLEAARASAARPRVLRQSARSLALAARGQ
jgi:hypothetical protein